MQRTMKKLKSSTGVTAKKRNLRKSTSPSKLLNLVDEVTKINTQCLATEIKEAYSYQILALQSS